VVGQLSGSEMHMLPQRPSGVFGYFEDLFNHMASCHMKASGCLAIAF
jgi:hypothetical protein